jgi:hypothetical protein
MLRDWWLKFFAEASAPDPIDHPALHSMSPDELADLPLWPAADQSSEPDRCSTVTSVVTELAM